MKIVCIGAAPTGLGAAFRLNELIGEGNEEAKNTEIVFIERVSFIISYYVHLSCIVNRNL